MKNRKKSEVPKTDAEEPVASACECTGMLPANPGEEAEESICGMLHVHPQKHRGGKKQ